MIPAALYMSQIERVNHSLNKGGALCTTRQSHELLVGAVCAAREPFHSLTWHEVFSE